MFTPRQKEILDLLPRGYTTNKQLGEKLGISHHTVAIHMVRIFEELGMHDRTSVALYAGRMAAGTAFSSKAVLIKGPFSEADWSEVLAVIGNIEQRHPQDAYQVIAITPELSIEQAAEGLRRTVPPKPGSTPDFAALKFEDAGEIFLLLRECYDALAGTPLGTRLGEFLDERRL